MSPRNPPVSASWVLEGLHVACHHIFVIVVVIVVYMRVLETQGRFLCFKANHFILSPLISLVYRISKSK